MTYESVELAAIRNRARELAAQESTRKFGLVKMQGWAGYWEELVEIVGETRTRYRIRTVDDKAVKLPRRWLQPGTTDLAPKHAVKVVEAK